MLKVSLYHAEYIQLNSSKVLITHCTSATSSLLSKNIITRKEKKIIKAIHILVIPKNELGTAPFIGQPRTTLYKYSITVEPILQQALLKFSSAKLYKRPRWHLHRKKNKFSECLPLPVQEPRILKTCAAQKQKEKKKKRAMGRRSNGEQRGKEHYCSIYVL